MLQTLELLPLDFYVCLRVKFHKSSFWVLILAAGGPYWVSISQKKWVPIGSLSQSLGVPNSFGDSDTDKIEAFVILSPLKFCDVAVSL